MRDTWPDEPIQEIPDSELEIKKKRTTCATRLQTTVSPLLYELLERYSDWSKLLKYVAWLCKYKAWLKNGKRLECNTLTVDDLTLAKRTIVSLVQHQSFPEELQDLKIKDKTGQRVKKSSSIVKRERTPKGLW